MTHPISIRSLKGLVALIAACLATASHAAPGDTSEADGTASAQVVAPLQIVPINPLRFGRILAPPTAGSVTIGPDGSIASSLDLTATPSTRAPAQFLVLGERNRRLVITVSNSTVISSVNGDTMIVSALTLNPPTRGRFHQFNRSDVMDLYVGGTLNVQANQAPGSYSGVFEVTVTYL